MAYYFFVDNKLLPVPPPKMSVKINNKNKTLNLINEGEVNIIKTPGLTEVSFEALMPNQWYPFSDYGTFGSIVNRAMGAKQQIQLAKAYIDGFETLKSTQTPFRLIVVKMTPSYEFLGDTNLLVTLEDYDVRDDAGEGFDLKVPLRFKQYRPYGTKELEVTTDKDGKKVASPKKTRAAEKEIPKAYNTSATMTVLEACKRASGGQLDWRQVAKNNNISNPGNVPKGTILDFWK